jgi:CRISPR-associated endoribonuclease Cas6
MRLRIIYQIEQVPIDYRDCFVSLFKEAIKTGDEEVYKAAYGDASRFTKPFCFSVFFQDFKITDDMIEIGGLTNLNISMLGFFSGTERDNRISLALFNGLRTPKMRSFPFPNGQELRRTQVQLLDEKPLEYFRSGTARFKTVSPILLTDGEKNGARPVLHPATHDPRREEGRRSGAIIDKEQFNKSLAMSVKGHVGGDIGFEPEELKVEVVRHTIGESMRQAGKPLKFVCFSGSFMLRAAPEDLHRIYQTGIGFKRNQGFGMLEVR